MTKLLRYYCSIQAKGHPSAETNHMCEHLHVKLHIPICMSAKL